uniref:Uncharacterized protein n=1 Tax=Chaetoceros debilis TaxID=122233 RepID=A0A7S3PTZ4_9STRA|mmetsp:Transcript_12188/g.18416  ORF Transcript_12188/g.18416 Transcript_12188/m.18416 type:complete len:124 (-) Transcript_12188:162-533(-)
MPSDPITKSINFMKFTGQVGKSFKEKFFCKRTFPKILGVSMVCSFVGSYLTMDQIHQRRLDRDEEMYSTAWETYGHKRKTNMIDNYDTSMQKPVSFQTRRLTRYETRLRILSVAETKVSSSIE